MRNIFSKIAASLALFALTAAPVLAHAPSVNITMIGGQDATSGTVTLSVALLPTNVNIEGTVTHEDPGNVNPVKLALSDNGSQFYADNNYFAGSGNIGTANFSVPWTITTSGSHQIVATVSHGNTDGTDTVDVTINLNIVVNQCPAAPAIAADYMHNTLGMKPVAKQFKGVMNQVAGQTGINGSLWAGHACDPGYRQQVIDYVNTILGI